jgi:AcrR family transcriptional regulator
MNTNESKERLRERIIEATRMDFTQGSIPSIAEIAQATGISRATFYRAFSSREELLNALALEPEPDSRDRLLAKALEMIGAEGLAALSMDALADAAGVSRATAYRVFPGKAVLFREVVKTYAPFEHVAALVEQLADRPPEEVMPQVAQMFVEQLTARPGVFRTLGLEISGQQEETEEVTAFVLVRGIGSMLDYMQRQVQLGTVRPIAPVVALQAFLGPLIIHLMTRALAERALGLTLPLDEVVSQFVAFWLRAMKPDRSEPLE